MMSMLSWICWHPRKDIVENKLIQGKVGASPSKDKISLMEMVGQVKRRPLDFLAYMIGFGASRLRGQEKTLKMWKVKNKNMKHVQ